jgi:hypothetical protein
VRNSRMFLKVLLSEFISLTFARHSDQTLTLLWFEDEEVPQEQEKETEEDMGLKELDGVLPWPGKKRRHR